MEKIDWVRKLTSRKLWIAVAGFVSGLLLAFGSSEQTAGTVAGVILQGASVLGYLLAEGLRDAAAEQLPTGTTIQVTEEQIKNITET